LTTLPWVDPTPLPPQTLEETQPQTKLDIVAMESDAARLPSVSDVLLMIVMLVALMQMVINAL